MAVPTFLKTRRVGIDDRVSPADALCELSASISHSPELRRDLSFPHSNGCSQSVKTRSIPGNRPVALHSC